MPSTGDTVSQRRGRLLSLEGVTGAGKTTVVRQLQRAKGILFAGGYRRAASLPTPFHRDVLHVIRRQLTRDEFLRVDWLAETLIVLAELRLADQALITPAWLCGKAVVYEHHLLSVHAYQSARILEDGRASSPRRAVAYTLSRFGRVRLTLSPRFVIFLDIDPALAAERAARRDGRPLTKASVCFNHHVAACYEVLLDRCPPSTTVQRCSSQEEARETIQRLTELHQRSH
jgi:thymidylate kinase